MKSPNFTQKFKEHRTVVLLSAIAMVFILGGCVWSLSALGGVTGNPLILHWNETDGIKRVGGVGMVAFMGGFGALAALMNFFIAIEFDARGRFLGKWLAAMTLAFAVLLFIAFAAIINVNV